MQISRRIFFENNFDGGVTADFQAKIFHTKLRIKLYVEISLEMVPHEKL